MTKIEWTDKTINFVWGCKNNCSYCYAKGIAKRFAKTMAERERDLCQAGGDTEKFIYNSALTHLTDFSPYWIESMFRNAKFPKKGKRIFMNSMSDISQWYYRWIQKMSDKLAEYPDNIYQFLTKDPLSLHLKFIEAFGENYTLPDNWWVGATVTGRDNMVFRQDGRVKITSEQVIKDLIKIPAKIKFLSVEPLVKDLKLSYMMCEETDTRLINHIDWVIVGGMSGRKSTPMHHQWVKNIHSLCEETKTPFFFKSWGEYKPLYELEHLTKKDITFDYNGNVYNSDSVNVPPITTMRAVGKKHSGCLLYGRKHHNFPD